MSEDFEMPDNNYRGSRLKAMTAEHRMTNYYEVLEIDNFSSQEEIDKAYRAAAFKYHPDKSRNNKNTDFTSKITGESMTADEMFQELHEAKEAFSKDSKQMYDNKLRLQRQLGTTAYTLLNMIPKTALSYAVGKHVGQSYKEKNIIGHPDHQLSNKVIKDIIKIPVKVIQISLMAVITVVASSIRMARDIVLLDSRRLSQDIAFALLGVGLALLAVAVPLIRSYNMMTRVYATYLDTEKLPDMLLTDVEEASRAIVTRGEFTKVDELTTSLQAGLASAASPDQLIASLKSTVYQAISNPEQSENKTEAYRTAIQEKKDANSPDNPDKPAPKTS